VNPHRELAEARRLLGDLCSETTVTLTRDLLGPDVFGVGASGD